MFQISIGIVVLTACIGIYPVEAATETISLNLLKEKLPKVKIEKESVPISKSASLVTHQVRPKQYGWGWSASSSSGSYDIYTLIAVAAFAALFGALFFELATGGTLRSLGSSISLPFAMDSEQITELMAKVSNFVSDIDWSGVIGNDTEFGGSKSRSVRDASQPTGVIQWVRAYKKDSVDYQCVRKLACETLSNSPLIAKSIKSPFGGVILSAVGMFIEHGDELQSIVQDTIGNPDKCNDMTPWGFCEDNEDELNSKES